MGTARRPQIQKVDGASMAQLLGEGKAVRKDSSIAWTQTDIFCICGSSKATLKEIWLIYHCRTMCEIPYDWIAYNYLVNSSISRSSDSSMENWKDGRQTAFFTVVNEPQRDEPYDVKKNRSGTSSN